MSEIDTSSESLRARAAEFREAPGLKGPHAGNWYDKPHRVVYDAARLIEAVATEKDTRAALEADRDAWKAKYEAAIEERLNAYQIVGALAHAAGVFEHPDVIRALDYLNEPADVQDILPWPRNLAELESAIRAASLVSDHDRAKEASDAG